MKTRSKGSQRQSRGIRRRHGRLAIATALATLMVTAACGNSDTGDGDEEEEAGFSGRELVFKVAFAPGGSSDLLARAIQPGIEESLGVNVRIVNEPAAGGLVALNRLFESKGDVETVVFASGQGALGAVLGEAQGADFDIEAFTPLPLPASSPRVVMTSQDTGLKTWEDVATGTDLRMAASGPGANNYTDWSFLFAVFPDLDGKIITGYEGGSDVDLGFQRGEVNMRSTSYDSALEAVGNGSAVPLLVIGDERIDEFPDVPAITELDLTDEQKVLIDAHLGLQDLSRLFFAAPELPEDQAALIQKAFEDALNDPAITDQIADITGRALPVQTVDVVQTKIQNVLNSPEAYKQVMAEAFAASD